VAGDPKGLFRKVVIGCGAGRCGTRSLSQLLGTQEDFSCTSCTHEAHVLEWLRPDINYDLCGSEIVRMLMRDNNKYVGDVGWYWVNYPVSLIFYAPDVRIICLQREREDALASLRKYNFGEKFLVAEDSKHYAEELALGNRGLPKYDLVPEDAEEKYYDFYYNMAEGNQRAYPTNFGIFPMENLNTFNGVRRMLDFVEIPRSKQLVEVGVRVNSLEELERGWGENAEKYKGRIVRFGAYNSAEGQGTGSGDIAPRENVGTGH